MLTASHSEPQTQSLPSLSLEFPKGEKKKRTALGPQPECSGVFDYTEGQQCEWTQEGSFQSSPVLWGT